MGQRLGSLIGAIGGLLFVQLNAGGLGRPVGTVVRVAGVAVFVVGVHFLPFARAFHVDLFRPLSVALIGIAVGGSVLALPADPRAVPAAAVAAGAVLLAFAVVGALRARGPATGPPSGP
ncbi:hypothetical protein [uncultured Friedmanniella sp.]|uniref:hypothetical protein n=1 Tax=uncultured Friedmanniella sp. TaxID=335381 RepID=UPI0035CA8070